MNSYKEMAPDARVWIYQSDRNLTIAEETAIWPELNKFVAQWAAHDIPLKAAREIFYDRFIVLMVDEKQAEASGCSIDTSVHFIQGLEKQFDLSLFDRDIVCYKKGEKVASATLAEFEEMLANGELDENTIVFNNMVTSKAEFDMNWEVPVKDSWHSRYLKEKA